MQCSTESVLIQIINHLKESLIIVLVIKLCALFTFSKCLNVVDNSRPGLSIGVLAQSQLWSCHLTYFIDCWF